MFSFKVTLGRPNEQFFHVFNLATAKEDSILAVNPEEAVKIAWEKETHIPHRDDVSYGRLTVTCGDWSAFIASPIGSLF